MRSFRGLTAAAVLSVVAAYAWTFFSVGAEHAFKEPPGYYGLLTDAILSGHFYLKVAPDPRLARLANPWAGYQGIDRMHDATYFHGRYYIYFGVSPVVILFAPWRLLTGTFLSEGAGVCLFGLAGFLLGLDVLRQLSRSQELQFADRWRALAVLAWGFSTYVFVIMQAPIFYDVPIACAFACLMMALVSAGRAAASRGPLRTALWLSAASLSWGLAVGSRPNYILSLPAIGFPLLFGIRHLRAPRAARERLLLAAAAVLPAALVGANLAWYNYSRFGSVSEFGIRYQFAAGDLRFEKLWSLATAGSNLRDYLVSDGLYLIHFPFFVARGASLGLLPLMPLALLGAAFPLTLLSRRFRGNPVWVSIGACTLVVAVVHLLGLCMLPFANDRYDVDFAPAWILLALGALMPVLNEAESGHAATRRLVGVAAACLALVGIFRGWMLVLDRTWDARTRRAVAVASERAISEAEPLLGIRYGPLRMRVDFRAMRIGAREALVETGGGTDTLFVDRMDAKRLRLGFVHLGNLPILGYPFPLSADGSRNLWTDLGSFYPPAAHPFFRGWDPSLVDAEHRGVQANVDGEVVLRGNSSFNPSDPLHLVIGRNLIPGVGIADFSGSISERRVERAQGAKELTALGWSGPVRLKLILPRFGSPHSEPLIASGTRGASDMIYVTYLGPTTLRFVQDSSDGGSLTTPDITYDPAKEHVLDVSYDALYQGSAPAAGGVILRFDGKWKLRVPRPTHPTKPYEVVFGYNAYGLGTASQAFAGSLQPVHLEPSEFLQTLRPGFGAIRASIEFVPVPPNASEPLLVSGVTGRGDIVYVRYVDTSHVRIGIDHWGLGAVLGPPIEINNGEVYELRVSSATFLPPRDAPAWGRTPTAEQDRELSAITVTLDGSVVAKGPWQGYASPPDRITVGTNTIGGSTCGPNFSGRVVTVERDDVGIPP